MVKNKISKNLINKVSVLSNSTENIFILSNSIKETEKYLLNSNINFQTFKFAKCFSCNANFEKIKEMSHLKSVDFICENFPVKIEQYEKDFMHIENITEHTFLGQNQTICFIDTGIYPHLDFLFPKSRILKFVDFVNGKTEPYDDNGHGTFVAGIACGNGIFSKGNSGFAPRANIVSLKALNSNGNSDSNLILDAMQWVFENHKTYNIKVVCMSFGADVNLMSDPLSFGAEALWKKGIVVVAAAGNSGPKEKTIKSPGINPNIITVGGFEIDSMSIADFSSRGPTIYGHKPDLVAPAVDVISCNNKALPYTKMSGTSVATPIVAGICACLLSRFPKLSNNQIKKFLLSNSKPILHDRDIEGYGFLTFTND